MTRTNEQVAAELKTAFGIDTVTIEHGLSQDELFDAAVTNDRGIIEPDGPDDAQKAYPTALGDDGPLVFYTDPTCTGRPAKDTFAVAWPGTEDRVWWKPDFQKFDPDKFDALLPRVDRAPQRAQRHALRQPTCSAAGIPSSPSPTASSASTRPTPSSATSCSPKNVRDDSDRAETGWTMHQRPVVPLRPRARRHPSERAVIIDIENRVGLVLGRADYCGVNKKTMFTVMNFLLPAKGQLSMHCSANVGADGDSAILFGLSGTGKTTLSADPDRLLIGDDEHVWTDTGVSNLEDGCYAKLIDLDKEAEPVIAAALSMPGTLIENVPPLPGKAMEETDPQELDLTDGSITENTRFAYPLACNPNVAEGARGPHPETIVLLTADAFGVLPPVSILDPGRGHVPLRHRLHLEARRHRGRRHRARGHLQRLLRRPFMSQKPSVYAELLAERMARARDPLHPAQHGWSGGPYGKGERMSLKDTRALLNAALDGELDDVETEMHPILGLRMPASCPGVDDEILNPRNTWDDPAEAYDEAAAKLRGHVPGQLRGQGIRRARHRPSHVTPPLRGSGREVDGAYGEADDEESAEAVEQVLPLHDLLAVAVDDGNRSERQEAVEGVGVGRFDAVGLHGDDAEGHLHQHRHLGDRRDHPQRPTASLLDPVSHEGPHRSDGVQADDRPRGVDMNVANHDVSLRPTQRPLRRAGGSSGSTER